MAARNAPGALDPFDDPSSSSNPSEKHHIDPQHNTTADVGSDEKHHLSAHFRTDYASQDLPPQTWKGKIWDTLDRPPKERRMLFKVDAVILTFASVRPS